MIKKKRKNMSIKGNTDQRGMASILITMITMIVVSLIVIGFATISRREQGQTLDHQLSTQAFYAAESGVEDARNVIAAAVQSGLAVPGKTSCSTNTDGSGYTPNYPTGNSTVLDASHNVSYSCLLVNPDPSTLMYDGVTSNSIVVPLSASQVIDKIIVTWSPTTAPSGSPTSDCPSSTTNSFSIASKWKCGYGLLRMDLVPTGGGLTKAGLSSSELSAYVEPLGTANSGNISYAGNTGTPVVTAADCTLGSYGQCSATIVGLASGTNFTLRLLSLYQASNIQVSAYHGGTLLSVPGAQAVVDVTGNANGVLRRIQVNIPLNNYSGTVPDFAIESNAALCKRFLVTPGYFSVPNDIVNPDTNNPMCVPQSSGAPSAGG